MPGYSPEDDEKTAAPPAGYARRPIQSALVERYSHEYADGAREKSWEALDCVQSEAEADSSQCCDASSSGRQASPLSALSDRRGSEAVFEGNTGGNREIQARCDAHHFQPLRGSSGSSSGSHLHVLGCAVDLLQGDLPQLRADTAARAAFRAAGS